MHTGQLFPAVCFWKNLIPDAVEDWFSLTSLKALIFLLRINNLSNEIFFTFLGFHKWSHTHTLLSTYRVVVHAFLLSPTYGCCCCYSKSLELGFIMATRGATMMIVEIDSATFPLTTFSIRGKSRKMKVSQSPLKESRKRPGLERDSSKFSALHLKTPHTGNARLQLFIVASMYAWFNNRCPSPSILHSSSMSPVLEC